MHGIILYELTRFAEERIGADAWRDLLRSLGLHCEAFTPVHREGEQASEKNGTPRCGVLTVHMCASRAHCEATRLGVGS